MRNITLYFLCLQTYHIRENHVSRELFHIGDDARFVYVVVVERSDYDTFFLFNLVSGLTAHAN